MESRPLTMKEIQEVSLEILKKITKVCEDNRFRYTLAFGTLIGAVRHKGFIPWDDDIDIQMPRPDYERFIEYMVNNPIKNLKVFNWKHTNNYIYGISRVCDMRYHIFEEKSVECGLGIFVDVYPIDGLGNTYMEAKKAYEYTDDSRNKLRRLAYKELRDVGPRLLIKRPKYFFENLLLRLKGSRVLQEQLEKEAIVRPFENYEYVGIPNWNWNKIVYKRKAFEEFTKVPFEDSMFYISKMYDEMLREEYGDYMILPPIEKRIYHHFYTAYRVT